MLNFLESPRRLSVRLDKLWQVAISYSLDKPTKLKKEKKRIIVIKTENYVLVLASANDLTCQN